MNDEQASLKLIEMREAGRIRLRVRGELDLGSAPALSERLRTLHERHERVVVDVDELEFIDMSGLRVLMAAAEHAADGGGSFAISDGSVPLRRLLSLVHLERPLPIDGEAA